MSDEVNLPQTNVKRIVQAKLEALSAAEGGNKKYSVSRDALLAMAEGGKVFVHYLTTLASEACKESKRATISAKDVFEVEFARSISVCPPLSLFICHVATSIAVIVA